MTGSQEGIYTVVVTVDMLVATVDKLNHDFRYCDMVDMKKDVFDPSFEHDIDK